MVSVAESGGPLSDVQVESQAKPAPRRKALIVLPLLTVLAAAGGAMAFLSGAGKETTDDAQVEGHVAYVAPHVAGQVKRVLVKDNQPVKAGDVLVELDHAASEDIHARALEPKRLVLYAEADHSLNEAAADLEELLAAWLPATVASTPSFGLN